MTPLVTYFYRAYGVTFASNSMVPGLPCEPAQFKQPDIVLSCGLQPDWVQEATNLRCQIDHPRPQVPERGDSGFTLTSFGVGEFFQLAYADGTRFVVDRAATRLWGMCPPPLTIEDLATYLSGPIMGFVLRRLGIMSLHASAVCIAAQAVLLCGESAAGKSTTAAALARAGVPVLTEDISPICGENGTLYVEPGYPRVCLWPDAVEKLFGTPEALPQLTPTWEKRFLPLDGVHARFEPERQPLGAIYLLAPRTAEADAPRIESLGKREALLQLVQNTYMNWLLDRTQRAAELDVLARIVERVPVRRIVPHSDPARVGALSDFIIKDAERLLGGQALAAAGSGR